MAIHPPNLYLGYIGTAIPFAFAIAALITRRLDAGWLAAVRRWTLALVVLQHRRHHPRHVVGVRRARLGRLLGVGSGRERIVSAVAREHGVPAFDHGAGEARHAAQVERHARRVGVPARRSSGTFITRSGVISSVHSFAQSTVGNWFAGFLDPRDRRHGVSRVDAPQGSRGRRPSWRAW